MSHQETKANRLIAELRALASLVSETELEQRKVLGVLGDAIVRTQAILDADKGRHLPNRET
jgi:hypothetical protein